MALVTEPADYVAGDTLNETLLNGLKNPIYDEFNGNIDNANIKAGAAIVSSKVADTAVVQGNTVGPGTQTITRPTTVSGGPFYETAQGGWSFYSDASNQQAISLNGATTFALTAAKGLYLVSIVGAETLTTITGGAEGDVIYILWQADDNTLTVTHTAAQTADTLSLRGRANETWTVAGGKFVARFRYSAVGGTGKWYEM